MEMVVVHPAYWKRGHGTNLVKWGMDLAATDKIDQGVIAAKMGTALYKSLGYKHLDDVRMEGDEVVPNGVEVAVMKYVPKSDSALASQL